MQSTNTVSDKKINRITILNIIGTLAYQGISFLLTPILTRALGSYDYGIITIYVGEFYIFDYWFKYGNRHPANKNVYP